MTPPSSRSPCSRGWAKIDNASQEDWRGVKLTLATGAPMSYALDLHTPTYVDRPDVTGKLVSPVVTGRVENEKVGAAGGDKDDDRIANADDLCPGDPEDKDGFEDDDGCPDPDNDKDRIADRTDKCPNEPETYNGLDDEDGCPDRGRVVVTDTAIEILDNIYFTTGSDSVQRESRPIVDAIAATLIANPSIKLTEVQGHADAGEREPLGLSDRRAAAVQAALMGKGVPASRLMTVYCRDPDFGRASRHRHRNHARPWPVLAGPVDAGAGGAYLVGDAGDREATVMPVEHRRCARDASGIADLASRACEAGVAGNRDAHTGAAAQPPSAFRISAAGRPALRTDSIGATRIGDHVAPIAHGGAVGVAHAGLARWNPARLRIVGTDAGEPDVAIAGRAAFASLAAAAAHAAAAGGQDDDDDRDEGAPHAAHTSVPGTSATSRPLTGPGCSRSMHALRCGDRTTGRGRDRLAGWAARDLDHLS